MLLINLGNVRFFGLYLGEFIDLNFKLKKTDLSYHKVDIFVLGTSRRDIWGVTWPTLETLHLGVFNISRYMGGLVTLDRERAREREGVLIISCGHGLVRICVYVYLFCLINIYYLFDIFATDLSINILF